MHCLSFAVDSVVIPIEIDKAADLITKDERKTFKILRTPIGAKSINHSLSDSVFQGQLTSYGTSFLPRIKFNIICFRTEYFIAYMVSNKSYKKP